MIGTSNAVGDYTLPSSFCTTGMIWHELNALINQTRCGKTVQPCWRGPDYSRWLKPNPLRSCQTGSVFFLFANVPEIWKYNNNEILVSAEHLRIGPRGTTQGRVPRLAVFDAEVVWAGKQGERVFLSENVPCVFLLTETSVSPPDHRHGALQDITLTHFLSVTY